MGISSLGVGSGILTQDVLDQLREADDAQIIQPVTLELALENDRQDSLDVIDASMTNFRDSIDALKNATVFDSRKATVDGTSISMTASDKSDLQDFTLNVTTLASKRIEESGTFSNAAYPADPNAKYNPTVDTIANATGTLEFNVTGMASAISIDVDTTTTLKDLKDAINTQAGDYAQATIVQTNDGEYNLFISSTETGASKDISISDAGGVLKGTQLTTDMDAITGAEGTDAAFEFNGQPITRSTNNVTDLVTGYDITLEEVGSSSVQVAQDRESIETKIDSFVEKYNSIISELSKQTLSSTDSSTRGIFSNESSIKSMKRNIEDMISSISGDGGTMIDYGFSVDRDGVMTIDKTVLNDQLDADSGNVAAFFKGGDYTKADNSVVTLDGAFNSFYDIVNGYTKTNGGLDLMSDSIGENISSLEDRKTAAIDRLDAKYEIMKKQYTAYNALINSFNASSDIFTQLANSNNSN